MSSISTAINPYVNAASAFFKNVGHTATTPAGLFLAAASAAIGGTAVYLYNRISSSNKDAADVAAAANSDKPLSATVASGEATSVSALFDRVTTSVKGWANSFVSFLSGLVPSFLRSKTEEASVVSDPEDSDSEVSGSEDSDSEVSGSEDSDPEVSGS